MNPPSRIRAVAIDLDGTLLDTVGEIAAATNAMLARIGHPGAAPVDRGTVMATLSTRLLPENAVRNMVGRGIANLTSKALNAALGHEPSPELAAHALLVFEQCYADLLGTTCVPYDGVIEGLDGMDALGLKLACITNKSTRFTLPLLERTGLAHRFEHVVCGDTYERRKPDPLPLLKTAERFGCMPNELLMIGDSVNDVTAARAAGCPILCVPYGYNEGEPVDKLDFDGMIHDLSEACAWIGKHGATNAPDQRR